MCRARSRRSRERRRPIVDKLFAAANASSYWYERFPEKMARGPLAARVRLHDEKRAHDRRAPSAACAGIHEKSRGGEGGQKVMRGVLHSGYDGDARMDLATKEQSSSSAIASCKSTCGTGVFVVTAELSPPVSTDPPNSSITHSRCAGSSPRSM